MSPSVSGAWVRPGMPAAYRLDRRACRVPNTPRNWRIVGVLTSFVLVVSGGAAMATTPLHTKATAATTTASSDEQAIIRLQHGQELVLPPTRRQKFWNDTAENSWSAVAITGARE